MAAVPSWVSDLGVWAGTAVALATLVGIIVRRASRSFVAEVEEIAGRLDAKTNVKLDHLHDCVESVKADVEVVRVDVAQVKADVAEVKTDTANLTEGQGEIVGLVDTVLGIQRENGDSERVDDRHPEHRDDQQPDEG